MLSQNPGQENDREQDQRLVILVVVLLAGEWLFGVIKVIERQVQRRRRRVLEKAVYCRSSPSTV